MSVDQTLDPTTQRWRQPGDFSTGLELPLLGHTEIEHHVNGVDQVGSHDNGTLDGSDHVCHSLTHDVEHSLELLDLLTKEDIKRDILVWIKTLRCGHS